MPAKTQNPLCPLLRDFAAELTGKFALPGEFHHEDQLKAPVSGPHRGRRADSLGRRPS